ncbi:MAG: class I SAM-dependent methyltransferase [Actinomycetota bacterium]|nr:class I SAM-dependent methyltransferase [Actinomycetota bacterium]
MAPHSLAESSSGSRRRARCRWEDTEALPELPELREVLSEARRLGYMGPGDIEAHIGHSGAFACVVTSLLDGAPSAVLSRLADLGSGGGVPALLIALGLKASARCVLIEGSARRAAFLDGALRRLGLTGSAGVIAARAEEVGQRPELRGTFDIVTARAFGRPAVAVECAAPLLRVGGHLVVSEPPSRRVSVNLAGPSGRSGPSGVAGLGAPAPVGPSELATTPAAPVELPLPPAIRWRPEALLRVGLELVGPRREAGLTFMVLRQIELCPTGFPRRAGIPEKRPLF